MGFSKEDAEQYIDDLEQELSKYGIAEYRKRLGHFFAQVLHDSGSMRYDMENLNYSAKALRKVFGKYFRTTKQAERYARQPEKIANRVGNGDEASADGRRYRDRGLIQLTVKNNYKAFSKWIGNKLIMEDPDMVASTYAVQSAIYFWECNKLNRLVDKDDIDSLTKEINGIDNGLPHHKDLLNKANGWLAMLELLATGQA